jgi:predicted ATPase
MAGIIRGWTEGQQAEPEAGVAAIEEGLAALEATGARMMLHAYRACLAETYWRAGRVVEALAAVEEGLAEVETNGRFYEAELHRLKGELLVSLQRGQVHEAEASLRTAVTVARMQNARRFERRAEASLHDLANPPR